jgi:hypothetical protein
MKLNLKTYLNKTTDASPLIIFRIGFGIMMFFGVIRFWLKGWIETIYIQPNFHFSYFGFEWVKPLGNYTYVLFIICGLAALFIALGFKYRMAIITFFLSFTYIELMDKTVYLNHYYFISIISFLMIFLPLNTSFSIDSYLQKKSYKLVPNWTIDSIKIMLTVVYLYAGLAKINSDWLLKAMPLKIWLPSKYDLPFLGENLMQQNWFHYAMSWSGMFYDLLIPFLLFNKRTRVFAFVLVVFFHVFTRVLFPIGMFPFVMIISTLIFFESNFHKKIILFLRKRINRLLKLKNNIEINDTYSLSNRKLYLTIIFLFLSVQLLFPFRHIAYPGELFWTEEGYRFSWRVMLIEKMGYTNFKIVDTKTKEFFFVNNQDFLSPLQVKQMSFQPDFILEYAHYLGDHYTKQGYKNIAVFAESHVALNGRLSQPFIDKNIDLYKIEESWKHKNWILPFNDEIKGL